MVCLGVDKEGKNHWALSRAFLKRYSPVLSRHGKKLRIPGGTYKDEVVLANNANMCASLTGVCSIMPGLGKHGRTYGATVRACSIGDMVSSSSSQHVALRPHTVHRR